VDPKVFEPDEPPDFPLPEPLDEELLDEDEAVVPRSE
jgi:hypothetical protein